MDYKNARNRLADLINRAIDEMEESDNPLTIQQIGGIEKLVKTVSLLEDAENSNGRDTGMRELSTKELEDEFD